VEAAPDPSATGPDSAPDASALPALHAGETEFRVVPFDVAGAGQEPKHDRVVLPPASAYLAAASLGRSDPRPTSSALDARLLEVVHGHGGAGALPSGAIGLDGNGSRIRTAHSFGSAKGTMKPLSEDAAQVVVGRNGYLGLAPVAGAPTTRLLDVARTIVEAAEFRAQPHRRGTETLHGRKVATLEEDRPSRVEDIEDGREVWVADPFDPALEGAPYPFRFRPIYFEDVKKVPGAGLRRLADRYVDWVPAAK
jgi:hypothetical protein